MSDTNKQLKLINNPLISKPEIYKQLGIGRGTFHEKFNGTNGKKFTEDQKKYIVRMLKKLNKQLTNGLYPKKKV